MKTLTTILALILSLTVSAQITGTWTLVKSFDTFYNTWEYFPDRTLTITQITPDTLKYTVNVNGTHYRGKTPFTGQNPVYTQTDFIWNVAYKTRCFIFQDTMTTHLQLFGYDTYIHYWKRTPFQVKTGLNDDPVISAYSSGLEIPFNYQLFDIMGNLVGKGTAGRVDISHLKSGIYFAKSLQDNGLIVKFVKQ